MVQTFDLFVHYIDLTSMPDEPMFEHYQALSFLRYPDTSIFVLVLRTASVHTAVLHPT